MHLFDKWWQQFRGDLPHLGLTPEEEFYSHAVDLTDLEWRMEEWQRRRNQRSFI